MERLTVYFLILFVCVFATVQGVSAKTWVEDFNQGNLDSWKEYVEHHGTGIWAPKTVWEIKNGRLNVWIDPPPTPGIYERFPYEFIKFPLKVDKLNVKVKIIEATKASVGILIGQYGIEKGVFSKTLKFLHLPFLGGAIRRPPNLELLNIANKAENPPFPLEEIEVSFDQGHFKVLSKEQLLIEFDVEQLPIVECVGIIAYVERGAGVIGEFVLDDFEISGPTFYDVTPKGKAAVVWGELKKQ